MSVDPKRHCSSLRYSWRAPPLGLPIAGTQRGERPASSPVGWRINRRAGHAAFVIRPMPARAGDRVLRTGITMPRSNDSSLVSQVLIRIKRFKLSCVMVLVLVPLMSTAFSRRQLRSSTSEKFLSAIGTHANPPICNQSCTKARY